MGEISKKEEGIVGVVCCLFDDGVGGVGDVGDVCGELMSKSCSA